MKIVPQKLYTIDTVQKIAYHGQSCILYKDLKAPHLNQENYISAHVLTIVTQGEKQISTYDGNVFTIHKNEVAFLSKDLYVISDLLPYQQSFESYLFFFADEVIDTFLASQPAHLKRNTNQKIDNVFTTTYSQNIRIYTESVYRLFNHISNYDKSLLNIKLLELLHLMLLSDETQTFAQWLSSINRKQKRNLQHFMEKNFDKPLKVGDYAYLTGRSPASFLRDFKRQFNTTPKKWLMGRRLEKAHQLLTSKDITVTEVAYEIGYENISHFIKAFKQKYNLSPKQFLLHQAK